MEFVFCEMAQESLNKSFPFWWTLHVATKKPDQQNPKPFVDRRSFSTSEIASGQSDALGQAYVSAPGPSAFCAAPLWDTGLNLSHKVPSIV